MKRQVKVLFDDRVNGGRKIVECELIEDRATTLLVKTPDGHLVTRKKARDLPKENDK